jgi:hypothetical protein
MEINVKKAGKEECEAVLRQQTILLKPCLCAVGCMLMKGGD